jgi:hypothetical protein
VMPLEYAKVAAASNQPAAPIGTMSARTPTNAHEHDTKPAELADMAVPHVGEDR